MKYKKINMGSYNLHLIKTDKFKTTTVSVNFADRLKKDEITIRKFLFQMLCLSTKKYNTERLLSIKLEDLYAMNLGFANIAFGSLVNSYIDINFLDSEFSDDKLLDEALDFLFEILLNPNVKDNKFDKKSFDKIYDRLDLVINSMKENTTKYALSRSIELMDETDPASFNLWGYKEDLDKINVSNLYEYYKYVIKNNKIDIFVVGNILEDKIINTFKNKFKIENECSKFDAFITYGNCYDAKEIIEDMNIKQSKLSVVLKGINLSMFERRYVFPLYTSILGEASTSRLFTNIREKNSYAYTVTAMPKIPNSLCLIYAGIDYKNYKKVIEMINKEIVFESITDEEIENARGQMINSIESLFDNPSNIINYYFGIEMFGADKAKVKLEKFRSVTKEDIINLSHKMKVAMIYLLRGNNNEEK